MNVIPDLIRPCQFEKIDFCYIMYYLKFVIL